MTIYIYMVLKVIIIILTTSDLESLCTTLMESIPSKTKSSCKEVRISIVHTFCIISDPLITVYILISLIQSVTKDVKCKVNNADVGRLETQLAQAKKAQERAEASLKETSKELDEMSKRCTELEIQLARKERELKCQKIAEKNEREEQAKEMNDLKLEVERLKRKHK